MSPTSPAAPVPAKVLPPPAPTRAGRIAHLLARSFPPLVLVPGCIVNFLALFLGFEALARPGKLELGWRAIPGAATVVLFSLLLRVYDELKDVETDVRLGRAGDPRYANRPIVTGHVRPEDLATLRWCVVGLLWAFNLTLGEALPFAVFVAVFFLTWLSFRWFFWPRISKNLLLAFVTHNPLTVAVESYVLALAVAEFGPAREPGWTAALLIGLWFPVAAWETSRKVRAPVDETDYETYSKALGWKTAALVPGMFALASAVLLVALGIHLALGAEFALAVGAAVVPLLLACGRFRVAGRSDHATRLQPTAELYALVANLALASALVWSRGVALA